MCVWSWQFCHRWNCLPGLSKKEDILLTFHKESLQLTSNLLTQCTLLIRILQAQYSQGFLLLKTLIPFCFFFYYYFSCYYHYHYSYDYCYSFDNDSVVFDYFCKGQSHLTWYDLYDQWECCQAWDLYVYIWCGGWFQQLVLTQQCRTRLVFQWGCPVWWVDSLGLPLASTPSPSTSDDCPGMSRTIAPPKGFLSLLSPLALFETAPKHYVQLERVSPNFSATFLTSSFFWWLPPGGFLCLCIAALLQMLLCQ